MSRARKGIELNAPSEARDPTEELRQHLVSASNELYLHALLCERSGREVPASLRRAHASIRAELRRLAAGE